MLHARANATAGMLPVLHIYEIHYYNLQSLHYYMLLVSGLVDIMEKHAVHLGSLQMAAFAKACVQAPSASAGVYCTSSAAGCTIG